jgi:pimeloyl-ACP methyl ester carboxylesterase
VSKILKIYLGLAILMASSLESWAYEKFTAVDLGRGNATAPLYVLSNPSAKATLILLPGGNADTGKIAEGKPNSQNFLARSKDLFQSEGFNVVVMFRPTDLTDLETEYRVSKQHVQEIRQVIRFAKNEFNQPVWLIGTSRGTVSATASAIQSGDAEIAGLVLSSSVTTKKNQGVSSQDISKIKVPVLVIHHQNDECRICNPDDAAQITKGLTSSPISNFVLVSGGFGPSGNPCEAKHWHGFINYENETVKLISNWIKNPST